MSPHPRSPPRRRTESSTQLNAHLHRQRQWQFVDDAELRTRIRRATPDHSARPRRTALPGPRHRLGDCVRPVQSFRGGRTQMRPPVPARAALMVGERPDGRSAVAAGGGRPAASSTRCRAALTSMPGLVFASAFCRSVPPSPVRCTEMKSRAGRPGQRPAAHGPAKRTGHRRRRAPNAASAIHQSN